jgi:hypothetical protein
MEEDQKLFDSCTQNFMKQLELEDEKQRERKQRWDAIEEKANANKNDVNFTDK